MRNPAHASELGGKKQNIKSFYTAPAKNLPHINVTQCLVADKIFPDQVQPTRIPLTRVPQFLHQYYYMHQSTC